MIIIRTFTLVCVIDKSMLYVDIKSSPLRAHNLFAEVLVEEAPFPIYCTDVFGNLLFFNFAAAALWKSPVKPGLSPWLSSWKFYDQYNNPVMLVSTPMFTTLYEQRAIFGDLLVLAPPVGSRIVVLVFAAPVYDDHGLLVGSYTMLVNIEKLSPLAF